MDKRVVEYKGIIHFHSKFSFDSVLSIDRIIDFAVENELNFLILTDHDTIKGSVALKNRIAERGLEIEVPIAAEYNTNDGDVIAAFIKDEIKSRCIVEFVAEVKDQGGMLLLPHPFNGHSNIESLATYVDLVESFNSRCRDRDNERAKALVNRHNKKEYFSPDAHLFNDLENVIVKFKSVGSLKESLLHSKIIKLSEKKTKLYSIEASRLIKGVKNKDISLLYRVAKSLIRKTAAGNIFRFVE